MEEENEPGVLYEVSACQEWPEDVPDVTKAQTESPDTGGQSVATKLAAAILGPLLWFLSWVSWKLSEFVASFMVPDIFLHQQSCQIPWKVAIVRPVEQADGVSAAILTEGRLEIRRSTDQFSRTVQVFQLETECLPEMRKIAWSSDGSFLTVAHVSGRLSVYDCLQAESHFISATKQWNVGAHPLRCRACSALVWTAPFLPEDHCGLAATYFDGSLRLFGIRPDFTVVERSTILLRKLLPGLVKSASAAVFSYEHEVLLVASTINSIVNEDLADGWSAGLSIWRMVNEPPYLVPVDAFDDTEAERARILFSKLTKARDGVTKMALSPSETLLVTLFASGSMAVWSFPSLRLRRLWMFEDMPEYISGLFKLKLVLPLRKQSNGKKLMHYPLDVQWWTDSAVILKQAGGAVSLLDVTGRELRNLTHGLFEQLQPGSEITPAMSDMFLILEENSSGKPWLEDHTSDYEDIPGQDSISEASDDMRSMLSDTLVTLGLEEPKVIAKPPQISRSYRLSCFQTASPVEMFDRKLLNEEYGEALLIASRFGLDADLVHQKRWLKSGLTKDAISDYLVRISNASWVLRECLDKVSSDPDVTRELLSVGLRLTDLAAIIRLHAASYPESPKSKGQAASSLGRFGGFEEVHGNGFSAKKVDITKLSSEQIAMIGHRRQLLRFQDMLSIYEEILGGGENALRYFLAEEYKEIRRKSPLELALHLANGCKPEELHTLRFLRAEDLQLYWLDIISNFPEICAPETYQFLIPSALGGEVVQIQHRAQRSRDWCEEPPFLSVADQESEVLRERTRILESKLRRTGEITTATLREWFSERVVEIERRTGLIDYSKQMIQIAKAKGVHGLDSLSDDLDTLSSLVYEAGHFDLTYEKFTQLPDYQVLRLLDSKKKLDTFPALLRQHILPFLKRCEKREQGLHFSLVKRYLVDIAIDPDQTLDKCLKVFQQSLPNMPDPVIPTSMGAIELAREVINANPRTNQVEQMKAIMECLATKHDGLSSGDAMDVLSDEASMLEELIQAVSFVEGFGIQLSVKNLRMVQSNRSESADFVKHLLKAICHKSPGFSEIECKQVFEHYRRVCKTILASVDDDEIVEEPVLEEFSSLDRARSASLLKRSSSWCFEKFIRREHLVLFVRALLFSGKNHYIQLATRFLSLPNKGPTKSNQGDSWNVEKVLHQAKSIEVLLDTGRDYFDNADNWKDSKMQNSKRCFELIDAVSSQAKQELRLIEAIGLLHSCGVDVEPLDIRTSSDRFRFIKQVLDKSPEIYKYHQRLLELARMLDVKDESRVLESVAENAFEKGDYVFCCGLCTKLIEEKRETSWRLCVKLAEAADFHDPDSKSRFLSFAIANCPDENLQEVFRLKNHVTYKNLDAGLPLSHNVLSNFVALEPIGKPCVDPCSLAAGSDFRWRSFEELFEELSALTPRISRLESANLATVFDVKNSEDLDELLIASALECFEFDVSLGLLLLGCLEYKIRAEECFDLIPETQAMTQLASYYYALEECLMKMKETEGRLLNKRAGTTIKIGIDSLKAVTDADDPIAPLLRKHEMVLKSLTPIFIPKATGLVAFPAELSTKTTVTPCKPSDTMVKLKGVDEAKFRTNPEYRKNFILRMAGTKDRAVLQNAMVAATENGIEAWEVAAAFVKFLFVNAAFAADSINEALEQNKDVLEHLIKKKQDFVRFSGQNIQPLMHDADISILEAYSDFLEGIKKAK